MKKSIILSILVITINLSGCVKEPIPCFTSAPQNTDTLITGQSIQLNADCSKNYTNITWQVDTITNYSSASTIQVTFSTSGRHSVRLTTVNKNVKGHTLEKLFYVE